MHLRLHFFVKTVLAGLSTFDKTLLILDVQLCFNLGLVDSLFLLSDLEVVFVLLLGGFVLSLALVFGHLLNLEVQLFFLLAQTLKLRLFSQILFDSPREVLEF